MSNEFGFRNYHEMQKKELGIFVKFVELVTPRLLWLIGA
jgi:hypothetical protein